MEQLSFSLEGQAFYLIDLEDRLKPMGFNISNNWEYDHGFFDYKISQDGSYYFLRLPFRTVEGLLDSDDCVVAFDSPVLLHHKYRGDYDQAAVNINNFNASINQFQTPLEKDAEIEPEMFEKGDEILRKAENAITGELRK